MFLVERLGAPPSFRAELPRPSYGSGDLVRAGLMTSRPADPSPGRPAIQTEFAFPASRQRKAS